MEVDKFLKQYDIVFAEDGSIKPCGREACKKLIDLAYVVAKDKGLIIDLGNSKTGFINVKEMHKLRATFN